MVLSYRYVKFHYVDAVKPHNVNFTQNVAKKRQIDAMLSHPHKIFKKEKIINKMLSHDFGV